MVAAYLPPLVGPQPNFGRLLVAGGPLAECHCRLGTPELRSAPRLPAKMLVLVGQRIVVVEELGLDLLAGLVGDVKVNTGIAPWGSAML